MATVYALINKTNGMRHIGITETPLKDRFILYLIKANTGGKAPHFEAIRETGFNNFEIVPLAEAEGKDAIAFANAEIKKGNCYNTRKIRGYQRHLSDERRQSLSDKIAGKPQKRGSK